MPKPFVFISSTSDLIEERQALEDLAELFDFYFYEKDRARKETPEEHCRKMIESAHVLVGILGTTYGTSFPGSQDELSIVEWEFNIARSRKELEIMAFIKKAVNEVTDTDPRQQRFLARVQDFRAGVWCRFFESPPELIKLVHAALTGWLTDFWACKQEAQAPLVRWSQRLTGGIAVFMFLIELAAVVMYLSFPNYFQITLLIGFLVIGMLIQLASTIFLLMEGGRNVGR